LDPGVLAVPVPRLHGFPGCAASAAAIERQVRHTLIFRGESVLLETSRREHAVQGG
jgi:hypothetical protein